MMLGNTDDFKKPAKPAAPRHGVEHELAEKIRQLQADREKHAQAIAHIDQVLSRVESALGGIRAAAKQPPAPPKLTHVLQTVAQPLPHQRRKYQKFALTGEESVLDFIRRHGNPTTAEINDNWHAEGRTGVANPLLARLLKSGLIERESDPSVRGSRYHVTSQAANAPH